MSNQQPYVPGPYVPGKQQQGQKKQGDNQRSQQQPYRPYQPSGPYQPAYNPNASMGAGSGPQQPVVVQATVYNPSSTTTATTPYAPAPSTTPSSYSTASSVYAPLSSTSSSKPSAPASSVYAPLSSTTSSRPSATAPASSVYAPMPSTSTGHSPAPAPTPYSTPAPAPAKTDSLPPFSMALDNPPPVQRDTTPTTPIVAATVVQPTAPPASYSSSVTSSYTSTSQQPQSSYGVPSKPPTTTITTSMTNSTNYNGLPTNGLVSEGNPVNCHKVAYEIKGTSTQLVEIQLNPGDTVIAEAGAMMFLEDDISFEAKFGDGSNPSQGFWGKIGAGFGRIMTGESLFITHFTNVGGGMPRRVAFAAPYPGTILPINMAETGEKIICQKDAFLCAAFGTKISMHFNKRIGSGFFGGEGFILQKLKGDGMAFLHAGGHIIRRELRGDRIRLDTGCLVAFTSEIKYDITLVKGLKSMFFGGEGLFLATLEGTGTVWMQSLPFSRMADRVLAAAGGNVGEGTPATFGLGDLVDGDGIGGGLGFGGF